MTKSPVIPPAAGVLPPLVGPVGEVPPLLPAKLLLKVESPASNNRIEPSSPTSIPLLNIFKVVV